MCPYFASKSSQVDKPGKKPKDEEAPLRHENYLSLSKILSAQHLESAKEGNTQMHDKHLFIITHQGLKFLLAAFKLWFKQMVFNVDSVRAMFDTDCFEERNTPVVIARMNRVVEIMKLLSSQFVILKMTPQDFFDFRHLLGTASGFQSVQFRLFENKLGLRAESRTHHNGGPYVMAFLPNDQKELSQSEKDKSLFDLINSWLERTPGLEPNGFDFLAKFKRSVDAMLSEAESSAQEIEDPRAREKEIRENEKSRITFNTLFDKDAHDELVKKGERRFSLKAIGGALMIFLYRDEPRFNLPFQLLQCLMDVDENFIKLRSSHACMVQRMVGSKIGTGGSSGVEYLRSTCSERYKIYRDLMSLDTFLIPRDRIPPLSDQMKKALSHSDTL